MDRAETENLFERFAAELPGWLYTLSGLTLVGLALLMPAYVEYRQLDWQAQVMKAQATQLAKEEASYKQFAEALAHDDPVLIERMAFYNLRLKPVGTKLIGQVPMGSGRTDLRQVSTASPPPPRMRPWRNMPTVEDLLGESIPHPPIECAQDVVGDSMLMRLTTGRTRYVMMAAGLLCLYVGLLPRTPTKPGSPAAPASPQPAGGPDPTPETPTTAPPPSGGPNGPRFETAATIATAAVDAPVTVTAAATVATTPDELVSAELDEAPAPEISSSSPEAPPPLPPAEPSSV